MLKMKLIISICLFFALPTFSIAGALERYQSPSVRSSPQRQENAVNESVYNDFEFKIENYSPTKINELKRYYRKKLNEASKAKNYNAELYYRRLLEILNNQ